jgi:hypothetical protein
MTKYITASIFALISSIAAAEWVVIGVSDDYIAYADPATISRQGDLTRMQDLIDLKAPGPSPYGKQHASSRAHSEFDCQNARIRTIAFSLHSGQMGDGDVIETVAESARWLSAAPGTLLDILWKFACDAGA